MLTLMILTACTGGGGPASVEGEWRLVSYGSAYGQTPAIPDVDTSIEFKDGQMSGNVGCNSFGGNYKVDGEMLTLEPIVSTLMACEDPMASQESGVFAVLYESATFALDGDSLTITSADGSSSIVLERR